MGEATYYMKIRYDSPEKDAENHEKVKAFCLEGTRAEEWWQNHRSLSTQNFWPTFKNMFPNVYQMLEDSGHAEGDCNNALAGVIDFCTTEEEEWTLPSLHGSEIRWQATVWHFADWGHQAGYFTTHCGADSAEWISDEYMDPFDCI